MSKLEILVVNDDGVTSPGIRALVEVMQDFGRVTVVAPDKPQSGMGHAITLDDMIRLESLDLFGPDVEAYHCSGTPVDCVKLAQDVLFNHKSPDLCVSGINHGANSSINVIYSGTMSAAMEAGIEGFPAIGFSLCDYSHHADMQASKHVVNSVVGHCLEHGLSNNTVLNVNIPYLPKEEIKGIKLCRQARARWKEDFHEREDPKGGKYFWLTGKFVNLDEGEDTDVYALENGFVSVVPVQFDLTAHETLAHLRQTWKV